MTKNLVDASATCETGGARRVARRTLQRVQQSGAYATLALSAEIARVRLSEPDRRLATELCYGVLRHRSRIDRALAHYMHKRLAKLAPPVLLALRVAAYQLLFLDKVPDYAAVNDAVFEVRRVGGPRLAGFANGLLRKLAREGEPPFLDDSSIVDVMERFSLPEWICSLLLERVGMDKLAEAAAGLQTVPPLSIRVNRLRTTREELILQLRDADHCIAEKSPAYSWALRLDGFGAAIRSSSFSNGMWTVQDVAAQLVGAMVTPRPGQRILDACAGVGGKTTHYAEMEPTLRIDAIDMNPKKIELLEQAKKRLNLQSIRTQVMDATQADSVWNRAGLLPEYDAVILDAPCSGLGVIRRHPEQKWAKNGQNISELVALQTRLLDSLSRRVTVGGFLSYSVCSFTVAEGPEQIRRFLARSPGFELAPPDAIEGGPAWNEILRGGCFESWPHESGQDAFFAARLRRNW